MSANQSLVAETEVAGAKRHQSRSRLPEGQALRSSRYARIKKSTPTKACSLHRKLRAFYFPGGAKPPPPIFFIISSCISVIMLS